MPQPIQIFIAYSRKDAAYLDELRTHLNPLERSGKVNIWYDGKIEPGAVWEESIKKHLHAADVILLLVSADAINSDYFYEKEMTDALARHHAGEARVVPLIVRSCLWQATPLKDLQALPKDGLPVTSWPIRDDAYSDAVTSLWTMITNFEQEQRAEQQRLERDRRNREEEARRQREASVAAEKEAERKQLLEKEKARQEAERQRQLEAQRRRDATEAERRRQQEDAARLKRAEEERQRKASAAQRREEQLATLGRGIRSPWAWGSGLALAVLFVFKMWVCTGPDEQLPTAQLGRDTTTLAQSELVDAEQGVTKISPQSLPPDVTVEPPKQEEKKPAAKPAEEKKQPEKTTSSTKPSSRKSGFEMVFVKGGSYMMGDASGTEALCPHQVTVGDFKIGKYEITGADWLDVMGKSVGTWDFCSDCAVHSVSWNEIQEFLNKASIKYGATIRLPTEEEWEYAARGGKQSKGFTYSGSNKISTVARYVKNGNGPSYTHVGSKKANELGIFDMSGNVMEWCANIYRPYPCYKTELDYGDDCRVKRGGYWMAHDFECSVFYRTCSTGHKEAGLGFRCVKEE